MPQILPLLTLVLVHTWHEDFTRHGQLVGYSNLIYLSIQRDARLGEIDAFLDQCSRSKLSCEFHFEGLSNFNASIEGYVQIQNVNPRI